MESFTSSQNPETYGVIVGTGATVSQDVDLPAIAAVKKLLELESHKTSIPKVIVHTLILSEQLNTEIQKLCDQKERMEKAKEDSMKKMLPLCSKKRDIIRKTRDPVEPRSVFLMEKLDIEAQIATEGAVFKTLRFETFQTTTRLEEMKEKKRQLTASVDFLVALYKEVSSEEELTKLRIDAFDKATFNGQMKELFTECKVLSHTAEKVRELRYQFASEKCAVGLLLLESLNGIHNAGQMMHKVSREQQQFVGLKEQEEFLTQHKKYIAVSKELNLLEKKQTHFDELAAARKVILDKMMALYFAGRGVETPQ